MKMALKKITENLDAKRKPLNNITRNEMKSKPIYPYYGANGLLDYIDDYIFDEEILCIAEDGGSWGFNQKCSYIVNNKCWVNNHAHVLRSKEKVNLRYIMHNLNYTDLSKYITGTTRGKLTKSALGKIEIDLPPLQTQNKIVEVLDKAQELIDLRKKQIELLDELIQSVFYDMFGDPVTNPKELEVKKIKAIVDKSKHSIKAGPFGSALKKEYYVEYGYKIYGQEQVIRDDFNYGDYYINEDKFRELESCKIATDDILISMVGTFGKISIVPKNFEEGIINPRLMKITLDQEMMIPEFFKSLLTSKTMIDKILSISHGGTMGIINTKKIKELDVIVPPVYIQLQFVDIKQKIEEQKELMKKSLVEMENNFKSLMQKAFKGELFN